MREIKFRAWDTLDKEMIYPDESELIVLSKNGNYLTYNTRFDSDCWFGIELMQYTGLKDKNGKEIYEGDIVESNFIVDIYSEERATRLGLIYWAEGNAGFAIDWGGRATFSFFSVGSYSVIGNKFENTKLAERINAHNL
jgi:hypothetical protein